MPYSQVILLLLGLWQGYRLVQGFGLTSLPVRLMSFSYFINYALGASISYHYSPWAPPLDVYAMQIDSDSYFDCVLPFMVILVIFEKMTSDLVDKLNVKPRDFSNQTNLIILIALAAGAIMKVAPSGLSFYLYLTSLSGTIQYLLSPRKDFPFYIDIWFWLAFFWPLYNSLTTGMFYDLIILGMLMMGRLINRERRQLIKAIILLLIGIQGAIIIQKVKPLIRSRQEITWETGKTLVKESFDYREESSAVATVTVRLNQGYLLSHFLKTHQLNDDLLERGEYLERLLVSIMLPRFLVPDKLMAGDRKYFEKHTRLQLVKNTSMGLGLIAESSIDFGTGWGLLIAATILMVVFLLFRLTRHSNWFLVFFTISMFYLMRPDCDLITALGHLAKCSIAFFGLSMLTQLHKFSGAPAKNPSHIDPIP
jgi:hypothetical protein